jgi:hypothetical protein
MKIENLKRARQLQDILNSVDNAIKDCEAILAQKKRNIHGNERFENDSIYSIYVAEYRDGSGFQVDLTNCGVGTWILTATLGVLQGKRAKILEEIDAL